MPIVKGYQIISSHSINKMEVENIIMIPITEKEEQQLDNTGVLHWRRNEFSFVITAESKPIYGAIDFHTNSDDYYIIEEMNWFSHLVSLGVCVPSDYNYEEHCCYSPIKYSRYYDTVNPAVVAQYKHGTLGKPERCCIFKLKTHATKRI